ncbi:MAG: Clp protease N-terminal domain-containing protein [Planctomycetota bacterium]
MLDRMTPASRRAMDEARAEARRHRGNVLGTPEILWGLVATDDSRAVSALTTFSVGRERIREMLDALPRAAASSMPPSFSSGARDTLLRALDVARELRHPHPGTAHLLMGLLLTPDCRGRDLLQRCRVAPHSAWSAAIRSLDLPEGRHPFPDRVRPSPTLMPPSVPLRERLGRHAHAAMGLAITRAVREEERTPHTGDLLLALAELRLASAAKALADRGVGREDVARALRALSVFGAAAPDPSFEEVARTAWRSARLRGAPLVETRDLLSALATHPASRGATALRRLNVDLDDLRAL